jgi:hypothetical protein
LHLKRLQLYTARARFAMNRMVSISVGLLGAYKFIDFTDFIDRLLLILAGILVARYCCLYIGTQLVVRDVMVGCAA